MQVGKYVCMYVCMVTYVRRYLHTYLLHTLTHPLPKYHIQSSAVHSMYIYSKF